MTVTIWPIEKIHPYARNARQIPQRAIDKVAASIQEFGWRQPIVVDRNGVTIVGHVRLLAAHKLGLREAPVHVAENLTPAQVRAYRLLDNRSHEETDWDEDLLSLELLDLRGMGFDLDLTGFDLSEIHEFLAHAEEWEGLTDPDAVPEVPETPVSKPGDVWVLKNHRVLCGDATSAADAQKVLAGDRVDMVFCDPPYGVNYSQPSARRGRSGRKVANDNLGSAFEPFLLEACRNLLDATQGAIYICTSSSQLDTLKRVFVECRLIELEPRYVDTAVMRWQQFTGLEARLEGDGRTLREVAEERVPAARGMPATVAGRRQGSTSEGVGFR